MKKHKYSSPYLSRDYFSKDILPHTVYAGRKTMRQPVPYRQHDEIEFMLVRSGQGTVTVNGRSYPAVRGSLFCFSPSHFHKLEIGKGSNLEISECHMNAGVYFYVTACPYYSADPDHLSVPPVCAHLDEPRTQQAERLLDELSVQCGKGSPSENQSLFFLLMKLFGLLEKYDCEQK